MPVAVLAQLRHFTGIVVVVVVVVVVIIIVLYICEVCMIWREPVAAYKIHCQSPSRG